MYSLVAVVGDLIEMYEIDIKDAHVSTNFLKTMNKVKTTNDVEQFECSVYDVLSRYGFMEGDSLIMEEKLLVEKLCTYLVKYLGIIDGRWQPEICGFRYVAFKDLKTNEIIDFYNMREIDRRIIDDYICKKNLSRLRIEKLGKYNTKDTHLVNINPQRA